MGDGSIVVFALGSLLGEISGKDRIPETGVFRGGEDCVTKVA